MVCDANAEDVGDGATAALLLESQGVVAWRRRWRDVATRRLRDTVCLIVMVECSTAADVEQLLGEDLGPVWQFDERTLMRHDRKKFALAVGRRRCRVAPSCDRA